MRHRRQTAAVHPLPTSVRAPVARPRRLGPVTTEPFDLVVPPAEQDEALARGARFDPSSERWYVPGGNEVHVHRFLRWLPRHGWVFDEGPTVTTPVLVMGQRCYRCRAETRPIVGVLVPAGLALDPEGFVGFDEVGEYLERIMDPAVLSERGIGHLRWRQSRAVPHGYVANACQACDALLGNHPLWEDLVEFLALGGDYRSLQSDLSARLPVALLEEVMDV